MACTRPVISSDWLGMRRPLGLFSPVAIAAVRWALMPSRQTASSASFSCTACCLSRPVCLTFHSAAPIIRSAKDERALHEGESRISVQRLADEGGRAGVLVEEDVLPGDQHIVEDQQRVDLVEPVGQRIVARPARGRRSRCGRCASRPAHPS